MTGYIIGIVLGVVIFLLQNLKPTSSWFRISSFVMTITFLWCISYAHLGYWNIFIIPVGVSVLCFISALCFPYGISSAYNEYMTVNGRNYFAELCDDDKIGRTDAPGFKQTYDRIIGGVLTQIVCTQEDFQKLGNKLYRKNFYPISIHSKAEVRTHLYSAIEEVALASKHGKSIQMKAEKNFELLFNAYISVMSIHEEATRRIEELRKED